MLDTPLMLWELSVTEQRYRAVLEVLAGVPVTEVADRYGVSRQSVHAWLVRYRSEGPPGLIDRSHKVRAHPWQIPAELESAVCELRRAHRKWGPKRLVFEMGRRGLGMVTRSTVYRVLVRNQLIEPRSRRRRRQDYTPWERPVPMQLWQLDVTASAFLAGGTEVKIVTGLDDHSRYCVIARAVLRATARPVCRAFVEAMGVYGVPEEVLTDNGTVFTGRFIKPRPAEVLFERICRENGITGRLTRPRSPTTTGKIERLHQSLQLELLDVHGPFESLEALQAALDAWRQEYNTDRPHQSPSPPPGSPRRSRRCRCGCRRSWPGPVLGSLSSTNCPPSIRLRLLSRMARRRRWQWKQTGWCRHRATCGSAGSSSGSARHSRTGRSPSG
jgi:transposase InsO family protein